MKSFYQSFPIEVIEEPYKIQKKDGTTLEGIRAQFHCPNGFPFSEVKHAMAFAAFLSHAIKLRLNTVLENNKDDADRITKTMNWIEKKSEIPPMGDETCCGSNCSITGVPKRIKAVRFF